MNVAQSRLHNDLWLSHLRVPIWKIKSLLPLIDQVYTFALVYALDPDEVYQMCIKYDSSFLKIQSIFLETNPICLIISQICQMDF